MRRRWNAAVGTRVVVRNWLEQACIFNTSDFRPRRRPNRVWSPNRDLDGPLSRERSALRPWDAAGESVRVAAAVRSGSCGTGGRTAGLSPHSPGSSVAAAMRILGILCAEGRSPSTGAMPLLHLSQNDRLRLVFPVPASQVPKVNLGTGGDSRRVAAQKNPRANRAILPGDPGQYENDEVEVDVVNADLSLVPGMYARCR